MTHASYVGVTERERDRDAMAAVQHVVAVGAAGASEEGFLADDAEPAEARRSATLSLAVVRGLFLDLHALEDTKGVDGAHELFIELPRSACRTA